MSRVGNPNPKPPPISGQFKPGQSGNPGGRPLGARVKLQGKFINALADDFEMYGVAAIQQAREKDPVGYIKTIASMMPKQIEQSQPLDDLSDAELTAGIALLRARLTGSAGAGEQSPPESTQVN